MRLIIFFAFVLLPTLLLGNKTDSLKAQLEKLDEKDQIETLTSLSWGLKYSDQEEALSYGLAGLDLARIHSESAKEAELLKIIGAIYYIKSDYDISISYCEKAIDLFQNQNNASGIAKSTNIIGLIHSNRGNYNLALEAYEKSMLLFQALEDTTSLVSVEANIGNVHFMKNEFQKAIPFYERIVVNARQKGNQEKLALNIFNLGMVYTKLGDYPKALDYLFEASNINKSFDNYFLWIKCQNEIGLLYRRLDLTDEAIVLYKIALDRAEEIMNKNLIASINNNLGLCYFKNDQLNEALECFNLSLEMRQDLDTQNVGHIVNNIARVHQKKGNLELAEEQYNYAIVINTSLGLENKTALGKLNLGAMYLEQEKYSMAEPLLISAYTTLVKTKELKELTNVTDKLSSLYQQTDRKTEALQYRKLNQEFSDSLYNKEKLLDASRIIIAQKIKENNDQISQSNKTLGKMKAENDSMKTGNNYLLTILAVLISLLSFGIYYYLKVVSPSKKILSQDLAHVQSEKDSLHHTLQQQNRDMVLFSLNLVQKEELIKTLKKALSSLAKKQPDNNEIRSLLNRLDISDVITKDWSFFNEVFNKTFPEFTSKIRKNYPNLSTKELQHCILIKLNTPPAEVANILGISTQSVHKARYRLRKKINLERSESLEDTILNL